MPEPERSVAIVASVSVVRCSLTDAFFSSFFSRVCRTLLGFNVTFCGYVSKLSVAIGLRISSKI